MASDIRLSGAQSSFRSESDIRLNYSNPKQLVCASNAVAVGPLAVFYSGDSGSVWSQTSLPPVTGDAFQGDPAVDWTSDGTAWALCVGIGNLLIGNIVRSFTSSDAGATWTFDSIVSGTQNNVDKPVLWVDHSPTSAHRDNLYALWWNNNPTYVSTRAGKAGTWGTPVQVSGSETTGGSDGGDVKTNAFGDLFAFWPSEGKKKLYVAKSTDGGASFGSPVHIADTFGSFLFGIPAQDSRRVLLYISGGAYRTASDDLVYAVWMDLTGDTGCTTDGDEPGASVTSKCKTRIWFSRSTDGGATWESPRMLNDENSLNDQFFPRLAVDETDGKLVVVYYDTIADSSRLKTDIWMQTSSDDGVSWSVAVKLTSNESDEATGTANANQYGDYIGLTGNAGNYFASWTDSRNAIEEIWGLGFTITVLVTTIADSGKFADVCVGSFTDELLTINNTGSGPISISNIISSSADFLAPGVLSYPFVLASGSSLDVVIRFQPTSPGPKSATLTIISNDPAGPHKVSVSGQGQTSRLSLAIADKGNFGQVCAGSFVDKPLVLNNSSRCVLSITAIASSSADFLVPEVLFFPLVVGVGDSLPIPLRFEPTSPGNKFATITVTSSDPASPHTIRVSGDAETSRLSLMIADTGHFGKVCIDSFKDEPLILNNSSHCPLTISGITSSSAEFLAPLALSYPLIIAGGSFLPAPIRFRPTSFGFKSAQITVSSSDPASPHVIKVEGEVPSGRLTICGSTIFGGVKCCHREQRTVTLCNTGDCNLHVSHVGFRRKRRHYRLINNPFPATLRPGSCLNVVIQYRASERVSRSCELEIHCDDPHHPIRHLDVIAYTIWDCCPKCCQPECCCKEQPKHCCDDDDDHDDHHDEDDDHDRHE
jgi:Abnormal spindle-like microcephaly-assoc'd, ASPM-SPD-2-Hydin